MHKLPERTIAEPSLVKANLMNQLLQRPVQLKADQLDHLYQPQSSYFTKRNLPDLSAQWSNAYSGPLNTLKEDSKVSCVISSSQANYQTQAHGFVLNSTQYNTTSLNGSSTFVNSKAAQDYFTTKVKQDAITTKKNQESNLNLSYQSLANPVNNLYSDKNIQRNVNSYANSQSTQSNQTNKQSIVRSAQFVDVVMSSQTSHQKVARDGSITRKINQQASDILDEKTKTVKKVSSSNLGSPTRQQQNTSHKNGSIKLISKPVQVTNIASSTYQSNRQVVRASSLNAYEALKRATTSKSISRSKIVGSSIHQSNVQSRKASYLKTDHPLANPIPLELSQPVTQNSTIIRSSLYNRSTVLKNTQAPRFMNRTDDEYTLTYESNDLASKTEPMNTNSSNNFMIRSSLNNNYGIQKLKKSVESQNPFINAEIQMNNSMGKEYVPLSNSILMNTSNHYSRNDSYLSTANNANKITRTSLINNTANYTNQKADEDQQYGRLVTEPVPSYTVFTSKQKDCQNQFTTSDIRFNDIRVVSQPQSSTGSFVKSSYISYSKPNFATSSFVRNTDEDLKSSISYNVSARQSIYNPRVESSQRVSLHDNKSSQIQAYKDNIRKHVINVTTKGVSSYVQSNVTSSMQTLLYYYSSTSKIPTIVSQKKSESFVMPSQEKAIRTFDHLLVRGDSEIQETQKFEFPPKQKPANVESDEAEINYLGAHQQSREEADGIKEKDQALTVELLDLESKNASGNDKYISVDDQQQDMILSKLLSDRAI